MQASTTVLRRTQLVSLATLALLTTTFAAAAQGDIKDSCIAASERAQQLRDEQKLIETRKALLECMRDACPRPVKKDCNEMLENVTQRTPSIVVRAKSATGEDITDARVVVDGHRVADRLDGAPINVDPGPHTVQVEAGASVITQTLLLAQGEHERLIAVDFARAPTSHPVSAQRVAGILIGVGGLAAVGIGSALGLVVIGDKSTQIADCTSVAQCPNPSGAASTHQDAVTASIASTILFGVGAVLLVTGVVLFFAPAHKNVQVGLNGLGFVLRVTF